MPAKRLRKGSSAAERQQGVQWLAEKIPFVDHPIFRRAHPEGHLQRLAPLPEVNLPDNVLNQPGQTFVAGFVSCPLLTPAEEQALFAWMNFHRYRAEKLRRNWRRVKSPRKLATQIRRELVLANRLRNRIVSSNLRLVVALAKKLARSLDQMSELISDGVLPLIRAVELFDISLGNRFSTYATWAARNQMLRSIQRVRTLSAAGRQTDALSLDALPARCVEPTDEPPEDTVLNQVHSLLDGLSEREQLVLRARFGLAGEPGGQSLADVAARVGLSKERVRQLVLQSLKTLRSRFTDRREAV